MANVIKGDRVKYVSAHFGEYRVAGGQDQLRKGSIKEITHDGDTVKISTHGNFSIRFLGIDTPEISFEIAGDGIFRSTGTDVWGDYLNNLETHWGSMQSDLGGELYTHLAQKLASGDSAKNHNVHAKRAEDKLEELIQKDMIFLGLDKDTMKLFLPFSYEILDGYGRLLAFVHPDKKNPAIERTEPLPNFESYNYLMLQSGFSLPYFIWPNINPFRKESSLAAATFGSPAAFRERIKEDSLLNKARAAVKNARDAKCGVFEANFLYEGGQYTPLVLEPFELRFLSRKSKPSRYFIDLESDDNVIEAPARYYKYLSEDRLFIPTQYVPLFEKEGWQVSE